MPGRQAADGIEAIVSNLEIARRLLLFVVLRALVTVKQGGYVPKAASDSRHILYWQPLDSGGSLKDLRGRLGVLPPDDVSSANPRTGLLR